MLKMLRCQKDVYVLMYAWLSSLSFVSYLPLCFFYLFAYRGDGEGPCC